jgi:hypothetical protein
MWRATGATHARHATHAGTLSDSSAGGLTTAPIPPILNGMRGLNVRQQCQAFLPDLQGLTSQTLWSDILAVPVSKPQTSKRYLPALSGESLGKYLYIYHMQALFWSAYPSALIRSPAYILPEDQCSHGLHPTWSCRNSELTRQLLPWDPP